MIIQAGIKRVIYREEYRDISGVKILREAGIDVVHLDI
jgi:dCMP deaminase